MTVGKLSTLVVGLTLSISSTTDMLFRRGRFLDISVLQPISKFVTADVIIINIKVRISRPGSTAIVILTDVVTRRFDLT